MGRPVKQKKKEDKDPQIIPRYQAMSTWKPRHMRSGKK